MNQVELKLQQAYELSLDLDRMEDYAPEWREEWGIVDAKVMDEFKDAHKLRRAFYKPEPINSVREIRMEGLMYHFEGIDYLYTEPKLPVMSKRMLSVLRSVRDFPHQAIPVTIEDVEVTFDSLPDSSGRVSTDYVAVQLTEQLDIFDRKKSDYDVYDDDPDEIEYINKLVLKVPESGLPPIFKIIEDPIVMYVSPEAKTALEEAGITGIRFVDINF